jgi:hypothetical protein
MLKTLVQHSVRWSLAAGVLATLTTTAPAGSFARSCAARDVQTLMMIEDWESNKIVASEKLRDVMLKMMHARIVCHEGHVLDALAIYDGIMQSLAPNRSQFGRMLPAEIR